MRYVAAYCLAALGGGSAPTVKDIEKILGSVGLDCDDDSAKQVVTLLSGQDLESVIAQGKEKLGSMPAAAAPAASGGGGGGGGAPAAAAAPKKEEKKEEPEEESDDDMGFGLFD